MCEKECTIFHPDGKKEWLGTARFKPVTVKEWVHYYVLCFQEPWFSATQRWSYISCVITGYHYRWPHSTIAVQTQNHELLCWMLVCLLPVIAAIVTSVSIITVTLSVSHSLSGDESLPWHRRRNDFSVGEQKLVQKQSTQSNLNYNFVQYVFFEKGMHSAIHLEQSYL